jgi:hypothetical protein
MVEFLSGDPITPTDEDVDDIVRRKALDEKRMEEQKEFYEIARRRAAELDEYMEQSVTPKFPDMLVISERSIY